ncbi:Phosphopantothenoylcysteine decarboxylase / Phosphopantothenoylcysteine synthetase [Liberibacter crescens BT-1]|uniref:Coenzyme A biosynthesis bifunctional protein CoaBC n=1 Tax=Liberibacter crescens (strain BT-1) TaxID=1215343 RepID=L0EUF1_LIBCB|nr:bifunctional phosphopantothenoylcysteine decarboxylase/phosphopantothenate--cysteine ligase CoaBC [Liberibacter crescens]AGA65179.1 Phosphopantothenoylcysteine decarboxylase / Phosphopantothenoylcysteine synthetase [Liberibacter crescens BT-1]AMC13136.1 bifunctional phosphopantothenoylcysteine decarboxylase/phosphopantothenate synthase [Liberibacter crescens]
MSILLGKKFLLIISGGIAAYKSLDLIRRMREYGAIVIPVMTDAAQKFITSLAVRAVSDASVYTDLFLWKEEYDVSHIRLARDCDAVLVAPATADIMACMTHGIADDLASAILLATDRPVFLAPAMNPVMWSNPATQRNIKILKDDGVILIGPEYGEMAESNEIGLGRMSEPLTIIAHLEQFLKDQNLKLLKGKKALVTSGPTYEPIDPVRYITNYSSGRQGHAIAKELASLGADVTLISGPVTIPDPSGVTTIHVKQAEEMLQETLAALPVDIAVMVAAVVDWKVSEIASKKIKKKAYQDQYVLKMQENPDILKTIGCHCNRPDVVIGFCLETQDLERNAKEKLIDKRADLILANYVQNIGRESNQVMVISNEGVEIWPELSKQEVARRLALLTARRLNLNHSFD